mmetsp:Transcript_37265/g.73313  ORF Transcript_37265/g.73313 Transcript_37265/m.73313 type:complete len:249 (-) Transcript_37265:970-1716(-)
MRQAISDHCKSESVVTSSPHLLRGQFLLFQPEWILRLPSPLLIHPVLLNLCQHGHQQLLALFEDQGERFTNRSDVPSPLREDVRNHPRHDGIRPVGSFKVRIRHHHRDVPGQRLVDEIDQGIVLNIKPLVERPPSSWGQVQIHSLFGFVAFSQILHAPCQYEICLIDTRDGQARTRHVLDVIVPRADHRHPLSLDVTELRRQMAFLLPLCHRLQAQPHKLTTCDDLEMGVVERESHLFQSLPREFNSS